MALSTRLLCVLEIALLFMLHGTESKHNNVCDNLGDYLHIESSKNCYYNEDYHLEPADLITKYTGNVETHEITTKDGHILTMFRIPQKRPKGVFLLQHAMLTNCMSYILQGNDSLAFYLWRHGYEIWLNNQRGTIYSKHVNLTETDLEYWDWSFHEVGYLDIDAQVKHMRRHSSHMKFIYYGYSLGTTSGLVYSSLRSEDAERYFKAFIYSGVTCYYEYNTSFTMVAAKSVGIIRQIYKLLNIGYGMPLLRTLKSINNFLFTRAPIFIMVLYVFALVTAGNTVGELDPRFLGTDFSRIYDNFSVRTACHVYQLMNAKNRFEMYDYGWEHNLQIYGKSVPDLYPIENITSPTYIVYSYDDILTTAKDALLLYDRLQPKAKIYGNLEVKGLNHEDLNFGIHRAELFMNKIVEFANKI